MSFFNGDMKITELNVGSDATGDTYFRAGDGSFSRIAIGTNGQVLTSNGTIPTWDDASGGGGGGSTQITGSVISTDDNVTYTAAQMISSLIYRSAMNDIRTDVTPTATDIIGALSSPAIGTAIKLCIFNLPDGFNTNSLTVNPGTGVTFDGGQTILSNSAKEYLLICTNVTDSKAVRIVPI